jgi:hypothetical protein
MFLLLREFVSSLLSQGLFAGVLSCERSALNEPPMIY